MKNSAITETNSPFYSEDKNLIEGKIWSLFVDAIHKKDSPLRIPIFSNIQNGLATSKVVVLRSIDSAEKKLFFHTDYRAPKVLALSLDPSGQFIFYDKEEKVQLKVIVEVKIHYQDKVAEKAWASTAHYSRKCYLVSQAPGTELGHPGSGLPQKIEAENYTLEESEAGYKNFCVLECQIKSIDWMFLAAQGHRRGVVTYNQSMDFKWLVP